jgi:DNA-binding MarR family transcriptional regulator
MALNRSRMVRESRQINTQLEQILNRSLAAADITGVQAHTLLHILGCSGGGTSVTELHRATGHSKATISHLIKQLRQKGYVCVSPCLEDDRCRLLSGTEKGARVQEFLARSIREAEDVLYQGFSPQELSTLDRLQKKMLHNLSAYHTRVEQEASAT